MTSTLSLKLLLSRTGPYIPYDFVTLTPTLAATTLLHPTLQELSWEEAEDKKLAGVGLASEAMLQAELELAAQHMQVGSSLGLRV